MNRLRITAAGLLTLLACASPASAAWQPAETISAANSSSTAPSVAMNAGGASAAIWARKATGTVDVSTRRPGDTWGSPASLSKAPAVGPPQIGLDDSGHAVAVWAEDRGPGGRPVLAAISGTGGWSAPADLTSGVVNGWNPVLAVNARGDAIVAWQGFDGIGSVIYAVTRPAGGSWSLPRLVTPGAGEDAADPTVAIGDDGEAVVAWTRFKRVEVAVWSGYGWQQSKPISDSKLVASVPKAGIDSDGHATIVWESTSSYGYHVVSGADGSLGSGSFGAPHAIAFAGKSTAPALAMTPGGRSLLAWIRDNGGHSVVEASIRPAVGDAWKPAEVVSDALANAADPDAAIRAGGEPVVAWNQKVGPGNFAYVSQSRGSYWTYPHAAAPTPSSSATTPDVALDSGGDAVVAFQRGTGIDAASYDAPPVLSGVQVPDSAVAGDPVSFSVSAVDFWSPLTVAWDFGDGGIAAGPQASHTYAAPGDYPVTVSAFDQHGNVTAETRVVHVTPAAGSGPPATGSDPGSATGPAFAGLLIAKKQRIVVRRHIARVRVSCPVGPCAGSLRLIGARHKVLGTAGFRLASGKRVRIRVRVARVGRVRALARAHNARGAYRTTRARLRLVSPHGPGRHGSSQRHA